MRVTPLMGIREGGIVDVDEAVRSLEEDRATVVATREVAYEVLLAFGCEPAWANARVHLALTGEWLLGG